jgi:hypothetical protein
MNFSNNFAYEQVTIGFFVLQIWTNFHKKSIFWWINGRRWRLITFRNWK